MRKLDNILFIGIGNNTRQDDGLGWCFIDELEKLNVDEDILIKKYQLMVEEADLISNYETVFFIDASKNNLIKGYQITEVFPSEKVNFSTHEVPPNQIMNLCKTVYNKEPKAYLIEIQGFEWDFKIELTSKAQINLNLALNELKESLNNN